MLHTLTGAVAATSLEASTILAAIRKGQITANQDLFGEWHLEDDELQRLKSGEDGSPSSAAPAPIKLAGEARALIQQTRPDLRGHYCGSGDRPDGSVSSRGSRQLVVVGTSPLQQGSLIFAEMATSSDDDICLDARDRVAASISPTCEYHYRSTAIAGALLVTLVIGWVGGWSSHLLWQVYAPVHGSENQGTLTIPAKPDRQLAQHATKMGKVDSKRIRFSHTTDSTQSISLGRKSDTASDWVRPASPVPETRPSTIEGWYVREVVRGVATLVGPDGLRKAALGDVVPGLGRVDSIVLWGSRWIVATSRGLITTE
jgi:hypothetical protein